MSNGENKVDIADEIGQMSDALIADDKGDFDEPLTDQEEVKPDSEPDPDPEPKDPPAADPDLDKPKPDLPAEPDKDLDPKPDPDKEKDKDLPEDETIALKAKIIELELAAKKPEPKVDPEPDLKPEPKQDLPEPESIAEENFLADSDLDDLTRDPKLFNKLLNTVYQKGIEAARIESQSSREGTLKAIPDIVKSNITLVSSLKKASENFYDSNKDLLPFKKTVAAVFEELSSENPDKKYTELFEDLGTDVRNRLGLKKVAEEVIDKDKDTNPNLPRNKGNRRQSVNKPKTDGLQSELDDMNKALGED